jgi:ribosomal protein S27E
MFEPVFDFPGNWKDKLEPDVENDGVWTLVRSATFVLKCSRCSPETPKIKARGKGIERNHQVKHWAHTKEARERYEVRCIECGETTMVDS